MERPYKVERIEKTFLNFSVMTKVDNGLHLFLNENFTNKGTEDVLYFNREQDVRNFNVMLFKHNITGKTYGIGTMFDYGEFENSCAINILNIGENNPGDLKKEIEGVLSELEEKALVEVGG